jgi:hypothetical protein
MSTNTKNSNKMSSKNLNKNNNILSNINNVINSINQNKFMIALSLLLLNIGSKYINLNLTKGQELLVKSISREILIFAISFMATRDLIVSLIISLVFSILVKYLFNENSTYCILPKNFKNLIPILDTNNDNIITDDEVNKAIDILDRAKKQEEKKNKLNMLNSIANSSNNITALY